MVRILVLAQVHSCPSYVALRMNQLLSLFKNAAPFRNCRCMPWDTVICHSFQYCPVADFFYCGYWPPAYLHPSPCLLHYTKLFPIWLLLLGPWILNAFCTLLWMYANLTRLPLSFWWNFITKLGRCPYQSTNLNLIFDEQNEQWSE